MPDTIPAIGIGVLLRDGYRAFQRALQTELATEGVTVGEWSHLRILVEEDGLTQIELCRRLGIQKASSTGVVDSLERRALIRRVRNATDRRKYNIHVTPDGQRLCEVLKPRVAEVNARARSLLSDGDAAALFRLVRAVVTGLDPDQAGGP